ncbi:MAG: beta-N-acetylhexosaminidase, partial [Clostridia bacterium]|nr:beta-N-acetylhexosaminidase [Clostridia bacterium]
ADGYPIKAIEGEEFVVEFDGTEFTVTYDKVNKFFRGLLLIVKNGCKKAWKVKEDCFTKELGIMLDCSRNAVRNMDHLKQIIRNLALMGYNQLQLYTEDTYEVEREEFFGYMRGRYTATELKSIDEYAKGYGIEVVPCIQTLAHLNQIFRWLEYKDVNDTDDILLIDEARTYELIENMFSSLSKNLISRKIHLGMDEAHMIGRGKYADKHGSDEKRSDIMLRHLNKVVEIAGKYGYECMMWSDMFFRLAFGGKYYVEGDEQIDASVREKVPANLTLVYWDYYNKEYDVVVNMINKHREFNRPVMFAGGAWTWTGFTPQNAFSKETTRVAMTACKDKGLDRVMFTMWGDDTAECSDLAVLPTLCYGAEIAYGGDDHKNTFYALTGINFDKFCALDLPNVLDKKAEATVNNRAKYYLYNDCFLGLLDAVVKKNCGKIFAEHAKTLKAIEKSAGEYAYLFTTQRTLCEVLEIKAELGVKTREIYKNGDRKALLALVKKEYKPLLKRLDAFYQAFTYQWSVENKPFGFEVQDYRIGGLIKRIEHLIKRLQDFVSGKVNSIAELDEIVLNPYPKLAEGGAHNSFEKTVTASILSW